MPPTTGKKNRTGLIVGIAVGVGVIGFLFVFVAICIVQRKKRSIARDNEGIIIVSVSTCLN